MGSVSSFAMPSPPRRPLLVVFISALFAITACASDPPAVPLGPDGEPDEVLALGRDVYGDRCANCHGASGGGGTGPRLAGAVVEEYPDPADQAEIVRAGRNAMPAFGGTLSEEMIAAVVRYTREVLG